MTIGRVLRILGPLALGLLLYIGPPFGEAGIEPLRGRGLLWLVLIVAALVRWPRLWALAPNVVISRIAVRFGAVAWVDLIDNVSTLLIALPLIVIGLSSAVRRLPSPVASAPGTIVPNADGIGALLSLPIVLYLGSSQRWALLYALTGVFALVRAVSYGRRGEVTTRGRGWLAFLLGFLLMTGYCFYWARPDMTAAWARAAPAGPLVGVCAWALQRAIWPWRNPTTTP